MSILNVVCFLLTVSFGYCLAQNGRFTSAPKSDVYNIKCPYLKQYNSLRREKVYSMKNILRLQHAIVAQKIVIDTTTCNDDRQLMERNFSVKYQDATDKLRQDLIYSEELSGQWGQFDARIEILLDPVIYSDHVTLTTPYPIKCSTVTILGCSTDDMCPINHCKNNGKCVGNGICACKKGFMGNHCEISASNMPMDDYGIVAAVPNLLITKDAVFDVIGDVSFSYSKPDVTARNKRNHHHHHHHHSTSHFTGSGGSCTYSSSHSSGLYNSGHSSYGYSPSNSQCSSILTSPCGFSYNSQMNFGYNHDHSGTNYLYSTHGTSHYSSGASMHYSNNQLCMHVHNSNNYGSYGHYPTEHYQVVAPFFPKPNVDYNICSSFSPQFGATMFVNGQQLASQMKPSIYHPTSSFTPLPQSTPIPHPSQQPLCFGSCGASTGTGHHNYSISNIGICGGSVPFLATNNILGLLGTTMMNLLFHHTSTTNVPTTKAHNVFTKAPTVLPPTTTLPPASATSAIPHTATSKYAPVCLECVHVSDPGNCSSVTQCNPGDVCLILHDKFGYTQRCISKQDCDAGVSKTLVDCFECCTGNFCNDKCTPRTSTPSTCQDEFQCFSLKGLGAYYDVCQDPIYSDTVCKKSCGNCPYN